MDGGIEIEKVENVSPRQVDLPQQHIPYAEHGAPIDHDGAREDMDPAGSELLWPRIRHHLREPFSEFFGTFILILFGDGGVAQVVLSNEQKGNYQSISWAWG